MNDYIELNCDSNKDDYLTANKMGKGDVIVTVIRGEIEDDTFEVILNKESINKLIEFLGGKVNG